MFLLQFEIRNSFLVYLEMQNDTMFEAKIKRKINWQKLFEFTEYIYVATQILLHYSSAQYAPVKFCSDYIGGLMQNKWNSTANRLFAQSHR